MKKVSGVKGKFSEKVKVPGTFEELIHRVLNKPKKKKTITYKLVVS